MQDITSPDIKPMERAALAKALDTILDRKRILRMKGAPKPVDVSAPRKSVKSGVLAPLQATPAPVVQAQPAPAAPSVPDPGTQ